MRIVAEELANRLEDEARAVVDAENPQALEANAMWGRVVNTLVWGLLAKYPDATEADVRGDLDMLLSGVQITDAPQGV